METMKYLLDKNFLSQKEQSEYVAKLMQWAVMTTNEKLQISIEYSAYNQRFEISIYKVDLDEDGYGQTISFYIDRLTKEKIKDLDETLKFSLNNDLNNVSKEILQKYGIENWKDMQEH